VRLVLRTCLWAAIAAAGAIGVSMLLPRTYRAEAKILPAATSGGLLAAGSDLMDASGLSGLLGGSLGGSENPILTFPEILLSRPVLERTLLTSEARTSRGPSPNVLAALEVRGPDERERLYRGVRALSRKIGIAANARSRIIEVSVVTRDSVLSAFIVNTLLTELNTFNVTTRTTHGRDLREFVESRLADTKQSLARAEDQLAAFQRSNLRIGNAPGLELTRDRLQREVSIQSDVDQLLERQYQMASIEEHRDTPSFTVLEPAQPPVRKYRPSLLFNGLSAACAAVALSLLLETLERRRSAGAERIPTPGPQEILEERRRRLG
jgi:uncharacterized protein involved in exopolysaccharide biosynthesis